MLNATLRNIKQDSMPKNIPGLSRNRPQVTGPQREEKTFRVPFTFASSPLSERLEQGHQARLLLPFLFSGRTERAVEIEPIASRPRPRGL